MRRATENPLCLQSATISVVRSSSRGAMMSFASGNFFLSAANASKTGISSPRCVLPARKMPPFFTNPISEMSFFFSARLTSVYVWSNFVFPVTVTSSGGAPSRMIYSASMGDCMANFLTVLIMSSRTLCRCL